MFFSSEALVDGVDVVEEFVAALAGGRTSDEVGRKFFPRLFELLEIGLHFQSDLYLREFVGFGEDDGEGDTVFAEELQEVEVFPLRFVADVYEHKEAGELLAVEDIVLDEVLEFVHLPFATLCIAVAGEIDEVPLLVDEEMVDEQGLAGR